MRTLLLTLLVAVPAFGQQRTWTISTDVVTTEADLLAVRGDTAYLKVGDKVEAVPLARLSAADHQYIVSLQKDLTPFGPERGLANADILPVPVSAAAATGDGERSILKNGPLLNTPLTEEAMPLPGGPGQPAGTTQAAGSSVAPLTQGTTNRNYANYNSTVNPPRPQQQLLQPSTGGTAPYRLTNTTPQNYLNANARALTLQQQQQLQSQVKKTASAQKKPPEPPPGLLGGIRDRRADRLRGR